VAALRSMRVPAPSSRIGPGGAVADGSVDGSADCRRQWDEDDLGALPTTRRTRWPCSSPRPSMLAPHASRFATGTGRA